MAAIHMQILREKPCPCICFCVLLVVCGGGGGGHCVTVLVKQLIRPPQRYGQLALPPPRHPANPSEEWAPSAFVGSNHILPVSTFHTARDTGGSELWQASRQSHAEVFFTEVKIIHPVVTHQVQEQSLPPPPPP